MPRKGKGAKGGGNAGVQQSQQAVQAALDRAQKAQVKAALAEFEQIKAAQKDYYQAYKHAFEEYGQALTAFKKGSTGDLQQDMALYQTLELDEKARQFEAVKQDESKLPSWQGTLARIKRTLEGLKVSLPDDFDSLVEENDEFKTKVGQAKSRVATIEGEEALIGVRREINAQQFQQQAQAAAKPQGAVPPPPAQSPADMALADIRKNIKSVAAGDLIALHKLFDGKTSPADKLAALIAPNQAPANVLNGVSVQDLIGVHIVTIEQDIKDQAAQLAANQIQAMIQGGNVGDALLQQIATNGQPDSLDQQLADLIKIAGDKFPAATLKAEAQQVQKAKAAAAPPPSPPPPPANQADAALAQVKANIQTGNTAQLIDLSTFISTGGTDAAAKVKSLQGQQAVSLALLANVSRDDLTDGHIAQIEQAIAEQAATLAEGVIKSMIASPSLPPAVLQQIATNGQPDAKFNKKLDDLLKIAGGQFKAATLQAAAQQAQQAKAAAAPPPSPPPPTATAVSSHQKQQAFSRAVADIVAARRKELNEGQPFEAGFEKIFRQTAWHKFDDPRANLPFAMTVNSDTAGKVTAAISEHGVDSFSAQELFKAMAISNHIFGKPDYAHQIADMRATSAGETLLSQFSDPMHEITQQQVADLYKALDLEGAAKVDLPALQQRLAKRNLAYLLLGDVNQAENIGDPKQIIDYLKDGTMPANGRQGLNVTENIRGPIAESANLFRKLEAEGSAPSEENKKALSKYLATDFEGLHNQSKAAVKAVSDCALYAFFGSNPIDDKSLARYEQLANNPSLHRNSAMRELRDNLHSTMGDYLRESGQALAQAEQMIAKYEAELRVIDHQRMAHPTLQNNDDLLKHRKKIEQDIRELKAEVAKIEPKYHRILNIYHKTTPPAENRVVTSLASIHQQTCRASELTSENVTSMLQRYDIVQQEASVSLQSEEAHEAATTNQTVAVKSNHVSVDIVQVNLSVQVQQGQGENATTRSIDAVRNCMKTTSHDGSEVTLKGWAERPRAVQGGGTSAEFSRPVAMSDAEKKQIAIDFVKTWVRNNGAPSEKNKLHINGRDPQLKAFTVLAVKELCQNMKSFDADAGLRVDLATRQLLRAGAGVFSTADVEKAYNAAGAGIDKEEAKEFAEGMKDTSEMSSTAGKVAADQQKFKERLASVRQDRQVQPEPEPEHVAIPAARRP